MHYVQKSHSPWRVTTIGTIDEIMTSHRPGRFRRILTRVLALGGLAWLVLLVTALLFTEPVQEQDTTEQPTTSLFSEAIHNTYDVPELESTLYAAIFTAVGKEYNIDPLLLAAIAMTESSINPTALSKDGHDTGMMQVRWPVWNATLEQELGVTEQRHLYNPLVGTRAGAYILAHYYEKCGVEFFIACYHQGPSILRNPEKVRTGYVERVLTYYKQIKGNL